MLPCPRKIPDSEELSSNDWFGKNGNDLWLLFLFYTVVDKLWKKLSFLTLSLVRKETLGTSLRIGINCVALRETPAALPCRTAFLVDDKALYNGRSSTEPLEALRVYNGRRRP